VKPPANFGKPKPQESPYKANKQKDAIKSQVGQQYDLLVAHQQI
jgi:hypothetical protein